jgi:hypothetical protein
VRGHAKCRRKVESRLSNLLFQFLPAINQLSRKLRAELGDHDEASSGND